MPIYEYRCERCGHEFESLVMSREDAENIRCPGCGSVKVAKALSTFAVGAAPQKSSAPSCGGSCPSGSCPYRS